LREKDKLLPSEVNLIKSAEQRRDTHELLAALGLRPYVARYALLRLRELLKHIDSPDRSAITLAIGPLLKSSDPATRAAALRALSEHGTSSIIPTILLVSQTDPVAYVRAAGLSAYTALVPHPEETVFIDALADADWRVRHAAVIALGRIGSTSSIPHLKRAMEKETRIPRFSFRGDLDDERNRGLLTRRQYRKALSGIK